MRGEPSLDSIVDRINRDNAAAQRQIEAAHRAAYATAHELACAMAEHDPTLRRVILFGSTLPGRRYRLNSDIDLAIDGGNRPVLERVAARVPQSVEIIGLEEMRPGVRERVLSEGETLYDANAR